MNKFEVGDKVRIREDFDKIRFQGDPGIVSEMLERKGCETSIRRVYDEPNRYEVLGDIWTWCEEWLERIDGEDVLAIKEIDDSEIISILEF